MADSRGARQGAASRNGGRGSGTVNLASVELDWIQNRSVGMTRKVTEVVERRNEYGGRTVREISKDRDGDFIRDVRILVVKYDKDGVVMERSHETPEWVQRSRIKEETIEAKKNIYGGHTRKETVKESDGGILRVVREVVDKFDKDGVVMEREVKEGVKERVVKD